MRRHLARAFEREFSSRCTSGLGQVRPIGSPVRWQLRPNWRTSQGKAARPVRATSRDIQRSKFGRAQIFLSEGTISDLRRLAESLRGTRPTAFGLPDISEEFGTERGRRRTTWDMPAVN
jgi:hypothetical protein